jgi:hypothetical protein
MGRLQNYHSKLNDALSKLEDDMKEDCIQISADDAEYLICFIRSHEREDVPEEVWDLCMRMMDELDIC